MAQGAWEMPAYYSQDGARALGLEYYHNTMLWVFPMAVPNQNMKEICSGQGFISRIRKAGQTTRGYRPILLDISSLATPVQRLRTAGLPWIVSISFNATS
jgi:hypothetical protein